MDCGISVFVVTLIGASTRNQTTAPSLCACSCMSTGVMCYQITNISIACIRMFALLYTGVMEQRRIEERERTRRDEEEMDAQLAAMDTPGRPNDVAHLVCGLSVSELNSLHPSSYGTFYTAANKGERKREKPASGISGAMGEERAEVIECPICLDSLRAAQAVIRMPRCTHLFHELCIRAWLVKRNQCPCCRKLVIVRN